MYLEYNLKKDESINEFINYTVSTEEPIDYKLLVFQKDKIVYPSSNLFASDLLIPIKNSNKIKFISNKNYGKDNFCFEYEGSYYLFNTTINNKNSLEFDGTILIKNYILEDKKRLRLLDSLSLKKSSQNVEFSTLKADFTDSIKEELPYSLQEIRIYDGKLENNRIVGEPKLLFTGFVDSCVLPSMNYYVLDRELEITLLSPMALTTKRYLSISGIYSTKEIIELLFEPLINDGFVLKSVNIIDTNIQVNYFLETIETIANDLSNKLNIFWYIDENKNIYILNILDLFNQYPKLILNETEKIEGLYSFTPTIEANNYFNTINIKNARVYCTGVSKSSGMIYPTNYFPILNNLTLNTDDEITFNSPIDMSITGLETLCSEQQTGNPSLIVLSLTGSNVNYNIGYYKGQGTLELPNGVVFDDQDTTNAKIILKRDSFFKSLITGFTWKGSNVSLTEIWSDCMLKYQVFKMMNSTEIEKCKGIISDSGIVEETIDVNESWFTKRELIEYCRGLITSNGNNTTDLELSFDVDYGLNVGDLISVNMPTLLTKGDFIITSIQNDIETNDSTFTVSLKNSKLTDNYIDLFRSTKTHDDDDKYDMSNIIEYADEGIVENYEVVR